MQTLMLNTCNIIRPVVITITALAMLAILAPEIYATYWPYLAAAGVLLVPAFIYRWWNARYNPGCGVRFAQEQPTNPGTNSSAD